MRQSELNQAVALATGESVSTIAEMGFMVADPFDTDFDPEPTADVADLELKCLDWDSIDRQRNVPLVYQPAA